MAIDSPLDQTEAMIAADDRRKSPPALAAGAKAFSEVLTLLGLSGETASAALSWLLHRKERQEEENQKYLLSEVMHELRYALAQLGELQKHQRDLLNSKGAALLVEAAKRTEETRDQARIHRLASIFVHGIEDASESSADEAEEFMRIVVQLSETDILVLREFVMHQPGLEERAKREGLSLTDLTNRSWREGGKPNPGLSDGNLQSSCARLQSFGLLVRIERVGTALSPDEIPYALLNLGERFAKYITSYDTKSA